MEHTDSTEHCGYYPDCGLYPVDPTPNLTNGDPSGIDLDGAFAAIDAGRRQAER